MRAVPVAAIRVATTGTHLPAIIISIISDLVVRAEVS